MPCSSHPENEEDRKGGYDVAYNLWSRLTVVIKLFPSCHLDKEMGDSVPLVGVPRVSGADHFRGVCLW